MHLVYNKINSAIAIEHLVFPFPPLTRKKNANKSENQLNILCNENTQAIHVYQHLVHSLQDGGLLVVADIFALDSSIS